MSAKSLAVARYILDRQRIANDSLTPMQLIKLVYIAHGFMLGWKGEPLIDEPVQAWQYGPVVPSVYHAVKQFRSGAVTAVPGALADFQFNADERLVLDYVADNYARQSGIALSSATHRPGTPWAKTWERFGQNEQISNDLIQSFYAGLITQGETSSL